MTKSYAHTLLMAMTLPLTLTLMTTSKTAAEPAVARAVTFRTVALSRTPAPGLPEGLTIGSGNWPLGFGDVRVDATGKVAFVAGLRGKGLVDSYDREEFGNNQAFYAETTDGLKLLLRNGDAVVPDRPELKLEYIQPQFDGNGKLLVLARLTDKPRGDSHFAVFTNAGGEFRPVLKSGDKAIGTEDALQDFGSIQDHPFRASGMVAFKSRVLPSKKAGLWSGTPDQLKLLAMENQQAPGMEKGTTIQSMGDFAQNAEGSVVFAASCVSEDKRQRPAGLWLAKAGESPKLLLSSKDKLDRMPEGASIASFHEPVINESEQVAVQVGLLMDNYKGRPAIVFYDSGKSRVVLKYQDSIPGTNSTVEFAGSNAISPSGRIAVQAVLKNKRGLILKLDPKSDAPPETIFVEGSQVPGAKEGTTFGKLNGRHQFGFVGDDTIYVHNQFDGNYGIFVSRNGGELEPVVQTGTAIEVKPGEKREVKQTVVSPPNDAGYLPFIVKFSDRSTGVILATFAKQ